MKIIRWVSSFFLALALSTPAPAEAAGKGGKGGKSICVERSDSSRANNTWSSVKGTSMAADFATPAKALRSLQDRQGGGSASKLGLSPSDMKDMRSQLDRHTDDSVLVAPDPRSGSRFYPSHVSQSTHNGVRTINEHYADPGTCEARFVGMVREIPVSSSGALQYNKARWSHVNSSELYHAGAKAYRRGNYLESFRMLGHTASWSEPMRRTLALRVKLVLDNVSGFRDSLQRIKLPANKSVQLRDAPTLGAPVIRDLSASNGDEVLKLAEPGKKDSYLKLGTVGNWDMVYDVKNEDVGFIQRIPGLGRRPQQTPTTSAPA